MMRCDPIGLLSTPQKMMFANISRCAKGSNIITISKHLNRLNNGDQSPKAHFSSASSATGHSFISSMNNAPSTSYYSVNSSLFNRSHAVLRKKSSTASRQTTISSARTKTHRGFSTLKDSAGKNTGKNSTKATQTQKTLSFLLSLGYSDAVSDGMLDALLQNGIPPASLLSMVKGLAGGHKAGEGGGLEALAASVEREIKKEDRRIKVEVRCLPAVGWDPAPDGIDDNYETGDNRRFPIIHSMDRAFVVEATSGTTLTDVAKFGTSDNCDVLGEYIQCACRGIMACSTCHVVIHPDWFDATAVAADGPGHPNKVGPPSEEEQDMIDLAYEPQVTSRLGCQIKLTKELNGLVVLLPRVQRSSGPLSSHYELRSFPK